MFTLGNDGALLRDVDGWFMRGEEAGITPGVRDEAANDGLPLLVVAWKAAMRAGLLEVVAGVAFMLGEE